MADPIHRDDLLQAFRATRDLSLDLCRPLSPEDYRIQSMPDVSPPWWNLGHTTWFFARNILQPYELYTEEDRRLEYPLNSYYESLGPRLPRAERGLVTRPTTEEIHRFRESVDERMEELLGSAPEKALDDLAERVTIGIHHEQQHQELLVTEIKHILGSNPQELREPYHPAADDTDRPTPSAFEWIPFEGGLRDFGNLEGGWCFDNEMPVHKSYLEDFALANRLVTHGEYLEFVEDGGYRDPLLWLSNGWARVQEQGWEAPMYWERVDGHWRLWTLNGTREPDPDEPVSHVSFYEADAYARWRSEQGGDAAGARLPTEREWEHGARTAGFRTEGVNLLDRRAFHPLRAQENGSKLTQTAGDLWEWTSSHYEPYPRYEPFEGALSEYNGKFMDNQRVLRGGSCATPAAHIRVSYRNFWPGDTRFQLSGIRLAKSPG